jgi:hypothetical protein
VHRPTDSLKRVSERDIVVDYFYDRSNNNNNDGNPVFIRPFVMVGGYSSSVYIHQQQVSISVAGRGTVCLGLLYDNSDSPLNFETNGLGAQLISMMERCWLHIMMPLLICYGKGLIHVRLIYLLVQIPLKVNLSLLK